jgi:response regulator of citrate/malate metabolism
MNKILIIEDDITINGLLQSIIEKTDILLTMRTME